jgi:predicted transcriptional regulator
MNSIIAYLLCIQTINRLKEQGCDKLVRAEINVKIDEFDELTAVIRLILYLYKNPKSKTTKILKSSAAGQRAFYSAKQFLDENGFLDVDMSTGAPLYSLSARGKKVAEHLAEVEKILGP